MDDSRLAYASIDDLLEQEESLRRLARALLGGEDGVDDVVQQTFLNALKSPPRRGTNLAAWLSVVARNVVRRRYNIERSQRQRRQRLVEREPEVAASESPEQVLARVELAAQTSAAVVSLAPKYRDVILLRFYEHLELAEIAEMLKAPIETVRTRLKRGLRLLERRLDRTIGGDSNWREGMLAIAGLRLAPSLPASPTAKVAAGATHSSNALLVTLVVFGAAGVLGVLWLVVGLMDGRRPVELPSRDLELAAAADAGGQPARPLLDGRPSTEPEPLIPESALAVVAPVPEPAPLPTLTGTVVDAITGGGIPGARLHLESVAPDRTPGEETRVLEATSDAHGTVAGRLLRMSPEQLRRSMLQQLRPVAGHEVLRVEADGYAPWRVFEWSGADRLRTVSDGEVDLGMIRLHRGTRLTGRVVSESSGLLVGEGELYVADLGVGGLSRAMSVGSVLADGTLQMNHRLGPSPARRSRGDLTPLDLIVRTSQGMGWVRLPESVGMVEEARVELVVGPLASLAVDVVDADGEPIEGALVRIQPCFLPLAEAIDVGWPPPGQLEVSTTAWIGATDAEGALVATTLTCQEPLGPLDYGAWRGSGLEPRGLYQVAVRKSGYTSPAAALVQLEPHSLTRLPSVVLRERPPEQALRGRVVDRQARPLQGVAITALGSSGMIRVLTDEQGVFELEGQMPQWMRQPVRFEADGYVTVQEALVPRESADDKLRDLVMLEVLPIAGTVVDQDGRPFANVRLELSGTDRQLFQYKKQPPATTDARGAFRFDRATAGSWDLRAVAPPDVGLAPTYETQLGRVHVQGGDVGVRLAVTRREHDVPRAVIDVQDGRSSEPLLVQAAFVRAIVGEGAPEPSAPSTHVEGARIVVAGLTPGDWMLVATVAGRGAQELRLHLEPGEMEIHSRIEFSPLGRIEGSLVWSAGSADGDAVVFLERMNPELAGEPRQAVVGSDGTFRFDDVPGGLYRLRLSHGDQLAQQLVQVTGDVQAIRMATVVGGRVVFRCRTAELRPLRASLVRLVEGEAEPVDEDGTKAGVVVDTRDLDSLGRSTMTGVVHPGTYRYSIELWKPGQDGRRDTQQRTGTVSIDAQETREVWID